MGADISGRKKLPPSPKVSRLAPRRGWSNSPASAAGAGAREPCMTPRSISALLAAAVVLSAAPAVCATYALEPTPSTVAWGHYDATDKPALTVKSGDAVAVH